LVFSLTDKKESENYGKYALSAVPMPESGLPFGNTPFLKKDINQNMKLLLREEILVVVHA
jgi:hypothetical protein